MARTRKHSRRHHKGSRKGSRTSRAHHKGSRYTQRGGDGFGYTGAAFDAAGGMAPVESRVAFSHCGFPARPGSLVGGGRRSRRQRGGNCTSCAPSQVLINQAQQQVGGGGGSGGYMVNVGSNDMGKMYASVDRAPCPSQMGGASMVDTRVVDSYSAGYGYAPLSAREEGGGSAHYLDPISYGRQCMGGGARRRRSFRRNRKSHRKGSRKTHSRK